MRQRTHFSIRLHTDTFVISVVRLRSVDEGDNRFPDTKPIRHMPIYLLTCVWDPESGPQGFGLICSNGCTRVIVIDEAPSSRTAWYV